MVKLANNSKLVLKLLALILFTALAYVIDITPLTLVIDASSENGPQTLQLYFNTGSGFSESESKHVNFKQSVFLKTTLKTRRIEAIRIDPDQKSRLLIIESISLKIYDKEIKISPPQLINNIKSKNDISDLNLTNDILHIYTAGEDPFITLDQEITNTIKLLKHNNIKYILGNITAFFICLAICLALFLLIANFHRIAIIVNKIIVYCRYHVSKIETFLFVSAIIWLTIQTSYFALSIPFGVPPDEGYHLAISKLHSLEVTHRLQDSATTYKFGAIGTDPYLYHFIAGRVISLFSVFGFDPLLTLRLFSVLLGICTLCSTWKLAKEVLNNFFFKIAILIVATNLLMYVFVFSNVSYTALTNFLAVTSSYFFVLFLKRKDFKPLVVAFIFLLLGTLTKENLLPFLFIHFILAITFVTTQRIKIFEGIHNCGFLWLPLIVVLLLNIELYGGNLYKHASITPSSQTVIGTNVAISKDAITRRNTDYIKTRDSREHISLLEYIPRWYRLMELRIVGIMGHKNLFKGRSERSKYRMILMVGCLFFLCNIRNVYRDSTLLYFTLLTIGYGSVLLLHNYNVQDKMRIFGLAVQGRYIFPILIQLSLLLLATIFRKNNTIISLFIIALMMYVMVPGGFIYFLEHQHSLM